MSKIHYFRVLADVTSNIYLKINKTTLQYSILHCNFYQKKQTIEWSRRLQGMLIN